MLKCKECGGILIIDKWITKNIKMYKCRTCERTVYLDYNDLKNKKTF